MSYIPGAPLTVFDPTRLQTLEPAVLAFFTHWYGRPFEPDDEVARARTAAIEAASGAELAEPLRILVSYYAGLEKMRTGGFGDPGEPPVDQFHAERFERLGAQFLVKFGDDDVGYTHLGVELADLGRPDPMIRAWSYDEDAGEWGPAHGQPLAGRRASAFLLHLLTRMAPGPSVIGMVPVDERFGFLQAVQDLFGMPLEADGLTLFEGEDTLLAVYYWSMVQDYAAEFVHRPGVPVSTALEALLARADVPGGLAE